MLSQVPGIPVHVVEDAVAYAALLILREAVRRGMRHQGVLVGKVLAADLAAEPRRSMMPLSVSLHVRRVHAHETALDARHRLRRVRLLHVRVEHELLGIAPAASDAAERSVDAVSRSQVRDQPGNKVELLLAEITGLLASFEPVIARNSGRSDVTDCSLYIGGSSISICRSIKEEPAWKPTSARDR